MFSGVPRFYGNKIVFRGVNGNGCIRYIQFQLADSGIISALSRIAAGAVSVMFPDPGKRRGGNMGDSVQADLALLQTGNQRRRRQFPVLSVPRLQ